MSQSTPTCPPLNDSTKRMNQCGITLNRPQNFLFKSRWHIFTSILKPQKLSNVNIFAENTTDLSFIWRKVNSSLVFLSALQDAVLSCEFKTEKDQNPRIEWKKKGKGVTFVYFDKKFASEFTHNLKAHICLSSQL